MSVSINLSVWANLNRPQDLCARHNINMSSNFRHLNAATSADCYPLKDRAINTNFSFRMNYDSVWMWNQQSATLIQLMGISAPAIVHQNRWRAAAISHAC
jgi:hypothetical protein